MINADLRNWDYSNVQASQASEIGLSSSTTTSTPGVWIKRFPGQMLRASFDEPQVRVEVGDSGALCKIASGCDFSFTDAYAVTDITTSYSYPEYSVEITFQSGVSVSDFDTLFIGDVAITAAPTQMDALTWVYVINAYGEQICGGRNTLRIKMTDGDALIHSDCTDCEYLDAEIQVDTIESTLGSVVGATKIRVGGFGFCQNSFDHVFIQSGPDTGLVSCKMVELIDRGVKA